MSIGTETVIATSAAANRYRAQDRSSATKAAIIPDHASHLARKTSLLDTTAEAAPSAPPGPQKRSDTY